MRVSVPTTQHQRWSGMKDLLPGKTGLREVIASLGTPESSTSFGDREIYSFCGGNVRVTFRHGETKMDRLWLSGPDGELKSYVATICGDENIFAGAQEIDNSHPTEVIYENQRVRFARNSGSGQLLWIEFFGN